MAYPRIPQKPENPAEQTEHNRRSIYLGILVTTISCGGIGFAVQAGVKVGYDSFMFVAMPVIAGFFGGMVANRRNTLSIGDSWRIGVGSYCTVAAIALPFLFEGIICLVMAAPIGICSMWFGAAAGIAMMGVLRDSASKTKMSVAPLAIVGAVAYSIADSEGAVYMESTSVVINAKPEAIWPMLFDLPDLPEPTQAMFKAGIAHPLSISSESQNVGASRSCNLSTGVMPETIVEVVPNRRLKFKVLKTPPSMKELNPLGEVRAHHLEDHYLCRTGEFVLTPRSDGKTLVTGTSVYELRIAPTWYWRFWCDSIVEKVHLRVMNEMKRRAEKPSL